VKEASFAQRKLDPRTGSSPRKTLVGVETNDPAAPLAPALPLSPAFRTKQAQELRSRIQAHIKGKLNVVITDNRSVMISIQRDQRHALYSIRLHHIFVEAPDPLVRTLARYIATNDKDASKDLNQFIDDNQHRIGAPDKPAARIAPPLIRTKGRVYDLGFLFSELNARYFDNQVQCPLTWGRHVSRGKYRRSIKVGSYSLEENLIRIHPGLDQEWIPPCYVRWVLFHEMLHYLFPAPVINGRHHFHHDEFAKQERRFTEYVQALTWERSNIAALLCI
jgi:hypothetical protein